MLDKARAQGVPLCIERVIDVIHLGAAGGDDLVDAGDAVVEEVRDPPLLTRVGQMDLQ